jgi:c-di-GMP-binding flagellar brake protein YcgR
MSKGEGRNVTLHDKNSVIARVVDIDRSLPVIAIQVGKETLENVILDKGSGVNLITEEKLIQLGLPIPLPDPY